MKLNAFTILFDLPLSIYLPILNHLPFILLAEMDHPASNKCHVNLYNNTFSININNIFPCLLGFLKTVMNVISLLFDCLFCSPQMPFPILLFYYFFCSTKNHLVLTLHFYH
jgi:hypothetical protein